MYCEPRWDFFYREDTVMTNSIQLKIPMTYDEQILNLQVNHGLVITDCAKAKEILKTVNYYRLSAYGIDLLDKTTDRYREGTSLEQIYSLYQFDSRLRNIISPVIEYVEIKLRSHIAYHLALKYGAECYRDRSYFHPWASGVTGKDMFDAFNEHVDAEIKKQSKKPMVVHHMQKYEGPFPIWVVVELLSLGTLSTLYSLMKREDQKAIAQDFKTGFVYVKSWFAALVEIRNICAHYGKLYNMPLDSLAKLSPKENQYANSRLFTDCLALRYVMHGESIWNTFVLNLRAIIDECPIVNLKCIGFPNNWEDLLQ